MLEIFGDFHEEQDESKEFLMIGFSPGSTSLQQRWRNNGLSADFLADYMITFFPSDENDPSTLEREEELKGAVAYIANELLENAMKFNDFSFESHVSLQVHLYTDHLTLMVSNNLPIENVLGFKSFIHELLNTPSDELYIRQIERADDDESGTTSGLGLLTMIDDYNAKLGWKFETIQQHPEIIVVTTMVQLSF